MRQADPDADAFGRKVAEDRACEDDADRWHASHVGAPHEPVTLSRRAPGTLAVEKITLFTSDRAFTRSAVATGTRSYGVAFPSLRTWTREGSLV